MTCLEKFKMEHPNYCGYIVADACPSDYGYASDPECGCDPVECQVCWQREVDEKKSDSQKEDNIHCTPDTPHILDSGARREFETGAVRDIQEGKGRCDLLPLDVVTRFYKDAFGDVTETGAKLHSQSGTFEKIYKFQDTGDVKYLYDALYVSETFSNVFELMLEVSKHFEEGCKKYGDNNWRKGIPTHCYIDSAVRHYLKYLRGDKDEPHDRAFCWNILCCIWTCIHKPELNDYRKENK